MIKIPTKTTAEELLSLLRGDAIPPNAPREDLHAAMYQAVEILADHEAMLARLAALVEPLGQTALADPTDEEIAESWQDFQKRCEFDKGEVVPRFILDPAGSVEEAGRPKSFPRWLILEEGLPGHVAVVKADDESMVRVRARAVPAALCQVRSGDFRTGKRDDDWPEFWACVSCHGDPSVGLPGQSVTIDLGDEREHVRKTLAACFSEIWGEPAYVVLYGDPLEDEPEGGAA